MLKMGINMEKFSAVQNKYGAKCSIALSFVLFKRIISHVGNVKGYT